MLIMKDAMMSAGGVYDESWAANNIKQTLDGLGHVEKYTEIDLEDAVDEEIASIVV
jgi:hypothetical protein